MKIKSILLSLFGMLIPAVASAQMTFGESVKINDGWKFNLGDVQNAQNEPKKYDNWKNVDLPHDWSVKGQLSPTLASCTGYLPGGIGWYGKTIFVDQNRSQDKVYLYFEGIYNRSEVYLNGHLLGKRPNGYVSFMYDATPYIQFGQENKISVRVDHSLSADSRWYTGSGIYRDAWMVFANPIHIKQWGVYAVPTVATVKEGVLNVEVEVENDTDAKSTLTIENKLLAKDGKVVASGKNKVDVAAKGASSVKLAMKVKNPALWDLENPNLYTLQTVVLKDGKQIDQAQTITGFRVITFDSNKGMALNGRSIKAKGVCIHHDAGVLGSAVPKEVWERRMRTLKEVGVNAIRTSHNPQASDLYEICDEVGLLVLNEAYDEWEFAKRKWVDGWNVGTPAFQGSFDFFKEWGNRDLADLVLRDRNHPSVFAWSIGNEVDYPNDPYSHPVLDGDKAAGFTQATFGGYRKDAPDAMRLGIFAKELAATVRKYDPSRPVTAGLAGVAMSNETEYPGALDIAGYNYTESRYQMDHEKYPNRVIYGSENRHDIEAWKDVANNDHIFGQFLWTGIDYLGESGRWPSRGFYSGLLDFGGYIKPRGYFRQSLWSDKPMAYIGTYPTPKKGAKSHNQDAWSQMEAENAGDNFVEVRPSIDAWPIWNYEPGQSIRVVCYTNAAKAKLLLNDAEVGSVQNYNTDSGVIYWDIPYADGKLEVVGLDANNVEISRNAINSSKQPYALRAVTPADITIGKDGLAQILIEVVDQNGTPVMLSDNEVTCHISGDVKLLGLEASNNSDMSDYTDNAHRVFHGKILAYIKATGKEGQAKVRFTSPWLKSTDCVINIK